MSVSPATFMPNSNARNKALIREYKSIARKIIARLNYITTYHISYAGSAYIYIRFRYCKQRTKQQIVMRISDHPQHRVKSEIDISMIKNKTCSTEDFIDECVGEAINLIEEIRMENGYYE
jgi:hypothetical protein